MSDLPKLARRILIGAGSFVDAQAALRIVEQIAADEIPEIGGLLFEETLVAEIAGPPRQRVVTSRGALVVAPSSRQWRTLLESDARAFRERLATLAQARKWSFRRDRGELISGLCAAARGWDLLLVGHRAPRRLTGRVALIAPPPAAPQAAAGLARELAAVLSTDVVALTLEPGGAGPVSGDRTDGEAALLGQVSRIFAAAVVLDLSAGPLRTKDQLRRLYEAARCPIFVLGAGSGDASPVPAAPD